MATAVLKAAAIPTGSSLTSPRPAPAWVAPHAGTA